jgi:hypothetical protein
MTDIRQPMIISRSASIYSYPDAAELNRWLPLMKWLLAIPHYIVLLFLEIAAFVAVVIAWFAILFTGTYPRGIFDFVEGVLRWHNRVIAYALTLVTDEYRSIPSSPAGGRHRPARPAAPATRPRRPGRRCTGWRRAEPELGIPERPLGQVPDGRAHRRQPAAVHLPPAAHGGGPPGPDHAVRQGAPAVPGAEVDRRAPLVEEHPRGHPMAGVFESDLERVVVHRRPRDRQFQQHGGRQKHGVVEVGH